MTALILPFTLASVCLAQSAGANRVTPIDEYLNRMSFDQMTYLAILISPDKSPHWKAWSEAWVSGKDRSVAAAWEQYLYDPRAASRAGGIAYHFARSRAALGLALKSGTPLDDVRWRQSNAYGDEAFAQACEGTQAVIDAVNHARVRQDQLEYFAIKALRWKGSAVELKHEIPVRQPGRQAAPHIQSGAAPQAGAAHDQRGASAGGQEP